MDSHVKTKETYTRQCAFVFGSESKVPTGHSLKEWSSGAMSFDITKARVVKCPGCYTRMREMLKTKTKPAKQTSQKPLWTDWLCSL